jgi:prepilin-type N-terminal cleavage/methylation domain-containing protein
MSSITNRRGFTLVELLTVIAIIAVLTALAATALRTVQSTSLQTAARQVSNTLQLARQYAINLRVNTRVIIAVDDTVGNDDLICRAYAVCKEERDPDTGATTGWILMEDWRFLPQGIVFSDQGNIGTVDVPDSPPLKQTRALDVEPPDGFKDIETIAVKYPDGSSAGTWTACYAEFKSTGMASSFTSSGGFARGIRLIQGSVLNPSTREILCVNNANWVYIEYDLYGGRVRLRYRDEYRPS